METKWIEDLPDKEGMYWFYGQRPKHTTGYVEEKKLLLVRVIKALSGFICEADGDLMWKSEIGKGVYCKVILPELPN